MKKKIIVTIGRQFGSGGRIIGKKLAEELGIAFYDRELIHLASKESGISGEFFERSDEKKSSHIMKAFALGFSVDNALFQYDNYLSDESFFQIQADVIRKVADEGSCVIVGRCADYILRENLDCMNIFVSAAEEDRIAAVMKDKQIDEKAAKEIIRKADKSRASYYNYYTDKTWGASQSYDLCVNSSVFDIDRTVAFIRSFVED